MTETSEEAAGPVKAVYGRITWGAYDQIFTVEAATTQTFDCQDDHGTIVEVAAFDPKRYETTHPVKLTCTATGRFLLTKELDETFSRLAASELPEGSRSEDDVKRQSVIGELALERVNAGHIEAVLAGVPGSAGTRHRVLATLRAALNGAVKAKQITWNPCLGIGDLEPEKPVRKRERWTPAEARKFLDYVADDPFGLLYRVMVTAAPRRSELVGLRWSGARLEVPYTDPDTKEERLGAVLPVGRTILQFGGKLHEEETSKSAAGDRYVFLDDEPWEDGSPGTASLLREHRAAQEMERMLAGDAWHDNDLIFCQPDGGPWNPDHVSRKLKRLAAKAGVRVLSLHESGRHTGNSLMYDAEVREDIVMRQVGHASRDISQRYNHPMIEAHLSAQHQVSALVRKAGAGS